MVISPTRNDVHALDDTLSALDKFVAYQSQVTLDIGRNLPIGSGIVESATRHIVQQRLKQSGIRGSLPGAQAVLNLRTSHRSGPFEQCGENLATG
jgi:hypothetical protein